MHILNTVLQLLPSFIKLQRLKKDYSHIGKWFLLDIWFKEKTKIEGGLNACTDDDLLIKKLKSVMIDSKHKNAPSTIRLSDDDSAYFIQKFTEFKDKLQVGLP